MSGWTHLQPPPYPQIPSPACRSIHHLLRKSNRDTTCSPSPIAIDTHLQSLREMRLLRRVHLLRLSGVNQRNMRPPLAGVASFLAVLKLGLRVLLVSKRSIFLLRVRVTPARNTALRRIILFPGTMCACPWLSFIDSGHPDPQIPRVPYTGVGDNFPLSAFHHTVAPEVRQTQLHTSCATHLLLLFASAPVSSRVVLQYSSTLVPQQHHSSQRQPFQSAQRLAGSKTGKQWNHACKTIYSRRVLPSLRLAVRRGKRPNHPAQLQGGVRAMPRFLQASSIQEHRHSQDNVSPCNHASLKAGLYFRS